MHLVWKFSNDAHFRQKKDLHFQSSWKQQNQKSNQQIWSGKYLAKLRINYDFRHVKRL